MCRSAAWLPVVPARCRLAWGTRRLAGLGTRLTGHTACACAWYQVLVEDVRRTVLSLLDCVSWQAFCLTSKTEIMHLPAQDPLDYYDQLALLMKSGLCSGAFVDHMVRTHGDVLRWDTFRWLRKRVIGAAR